MLLLGAGSSFYVPAFCTLVTAILEHGPSVDGHQILALQDAIRAIEDDHDPTAPCLASLGTAKTLLEVLERTEWVRLEVINPAIQKVATEAVSRVSSVLCRDRLRATFDCS